MPTHPKRAPGSARNRYIAIALVLVNLIHFHSKVKRNGDSKILERSQALPVIPEYA